MLRSWKDKVVSQPASRVAQLPDVPGVGCTVCKVVLGLVSVCGRGQLPTDVYREKSHNGRLGVTEGVHSPGYRFHTTLRDIGRKSRSPGPDPSISTPCSCRGVVVCFEYTTCARCSSLQDVRWDSSCSALFHSETCIARSLYALYGMTLCRHLPAPHPLALDAVRFHLCYIQTLGGFHSLRPVVFILHCSINHSAES